MDVPLIIADFVHLMSITGLLLKILYTRKCNDVSVKTQFLLALVFITRYLDTFTACIPTAYSFITRGLSILVTCSTLMTICGCCRKSYESKHDAYRIMTLLAPCLVLSVFFNHDSTIIGISWAFSEYLEAVAMVPQFVLLANVRHAHVSVLCYITAHTVYKCLHVVHWIRQYHQLKTFDKISASSSIIQCLLYSDFFLNIWHRLEPVIDEATDVKSEKVYEENAYLSSNINFVELDSSFF
ncbi:hypothetical protein TSAR_015072 [Trichomalopsis sarcophagae]|uniref:ER lumen protein-retaining receptor n=1 Tax=Trichomalopsis sarcophagae TaxID=543379 RepID=A0A232EWT4_9HYME|nr:hypothetical protein TSAR_015072 [Trichomalopsis sarcophagae]